jgi:histidine ammonia-lyase/tyrosine ammonia-lyase
MDTEHSKAVALRQAYHVVPDRPPASACAAVLDRLAEVVAPVDRDRPLDEDVRRAADLLDELADESSGPFDPVPDAS